MAGENELFTKSFQHLCPFLRWNRRLLVRLVTVVVSWEGFRDPARNEERREIGKELVDLVARKRARLLMLPAGLLGVDSGKRARAKSKRVPRAVNRYSALPGSPERHFIGVGAKLVTVLACGEAFHRDLRDSAERAGGCVLNPCHTAGGARYSRALEWARGVDLRLLRSVHAANPWNVTSGTDGDPLDPLKGPPLVLPRLVKL